MERSPNQVPHTRAVESTAVRTNRRGELMPSRARKPEKTARARNGRSGARRRLARDGHIRRSPRYKGPVRTTNRDLLHRAAHPTARSPMQEPPEPISDPRRHRGASSRRFRSAERRGIPGAGGQRERAEPSSHGRAARRKVRECSEAPGVILLAARALQTSQGTDKVTPQAAATTAFRRLPAHAAASAAAGHSTRPAARVATQPRRRGRTLRLQSLHLPRFPEPCWQPGKRRAPR